LPYFSLLQRLDQHLLRLWKGVKAASRTIGCKKVLDDVRELMEGEEDASSRLPASSGRSIAFLVALPSCRARKPQEEVRNQWLHASADLAAQDRLVLDVLEQFLRSAFESGSEVRLPA
jgi:hypothetical protein